MTTSPNRTTIRLVEALSSRLSVDPAARLSQSHFVRALVDAFIASEARIESVRTLGVRLDSKADATPTSLAVPPAVLAHYKRYAKAAGGHTLGALVSSALSAHYFSTGMPVQPNARPEGKVRGWRATLLALNVGQTVELTRADLLTTLHRARLNIFATADALRDALPAFRVTTRRTPRTLYVTRAA